MRVSIQALTVEIFRCMFPFRMISDTRIECRHADSRWSGSPCAPVGARRGKELSREARVRLDCMDFYHRCRNVARTCRHFGISRQTFYRWHRRYNPYNLNTLEARSPPPSSPPPSPLSLPAWPIASWLCATAIPAGARTSLASCSASAHPDFHFHGWAAS